jgi:hypothetical protein
MSKATGASALFGVKIDAPSDTYSVGRPAPDVIVVTAPATPPTWAAGAAGNLTGSFAYRVAYGQADGAMTTPSAADATISAVAFTGSGLNDATSGGTFTGGANCTFTVIIDAAAGTDTFKWKKNSGAYTTGVAMSGSPQTLSDGVTIDFAATTGHTLADQWVITVTIGVQAVTAQAIDISAIPTSASTKVDRRVIERTDDNGTTWAICGTIYDNTTTTFTDDVATLDDSKVIPSTNQTGANYGYTFWELDSYDSEPDFTNLPVMALLGTAGKPRSIPGPIKITGSPKSDLRPCELAPILTSGGGDPDTYTQVAGEPTFIGTWNATTGKRNARTISAMTYDGSTALVPGFLYGLACEELTFDFSGGKITGITPKFIGANYGTSAPSAQIAGTGTWAGTFVALGQRYDADALTKSVFIKITQAYSANTIKFKVSVDTHASAGTGTYGDEYTMYANATSNNQTKGGLQYNDSIEIADQNGIFLGADSGSNRQPFTIVATAPLAVSVIDVNDIFEILPTAAIPGTGASPFSGVPARFSVGPRLTDAHVTIIQDSAVVEATSGSLKFMWPKKEVNALCAGARMVQDLPNEGFFGVELTVVRFLDSTGNETTIRTDDRVVAQVRLEGERIPINPGSLSTYREALIVDLPQMAAKSVKSPVTGQVLVVETSVFEAEQPDNPDDDLYTATLQSRQGWIYPS